MGFRDHLLRDAFDINSALRSGDGYRQTAFLGAVNNDRLPAFFGRKVNSGTNVAFGLTFHTDRVPRILNRREEILQRHRLAGLAQLDTPYTADRRRLDVLRECTSVGEAAPIIRNWRFHESGTGRATSWAAEPPAR